MQPLNTIRQLGYVVSNLDEAIKYWVEVVGAGPFFIIKHCALREQIYRGQPCAVDVDMRWVTAATCRLSLFTSITMRLQFTTKPILPDT